MGDVSRQRWLGRWQLLLPLLVLDCGGRVADSSPPEVDPLPAALTVNEFLPRLQDAICRSADACCERAGFVPAVDCRSAVRAHWQPIVDRAKGIGATFDAAQALNCIANHQTEWSACASIKVQASTTDSDCGKVFVAPSPRSLLGAACLASMDCNQAADETVICFRIGTELGVTGVCLRNLQSGSDEICGGANGTTNANCLAPLACAADLRCHPRAKLRESCSDLGGDTCETGSVCDVGGSRLCKRAFALGEPCTRDSECENFACLGGSCRVYPDLALSWYCQERLPRPAQ